MSCIAAVSLLNPGGFLEPMWRVNPRAREAFTGLGIWGPLLMAAVCLACGGAAIGLRQRRWWGYRLGVGLLLTNLIGDTANVVLGTEPRAAIGIPIVLAILIYLGRPKVRDAFTSSIESG